MKTKKKRGFPVALLIAAAVLLIVVGSFAGYVIAESSDHAEPVRYLSDMDPVYASVGWGSYGVDQNPNGTTISLRVDGSVRSFEKGVGAHATSALIFTVHDLYEEGYRYFSTYYGVDASMSGNVRFYLYYTTDKEYTDAEWILCDGVDTSALSGSSAARFLEVSLNRKMTYLLLYADENGSNAQDHAVYGDAKFLTEEYFDPSIRRVEQYDADLSSYYRKYGTDITADAAYEQLLLERTLVDAAGYSALQGLLTEDAGYGEMLSWLFSDTDLMKLFLTGGSPGGNVLNGTSTYGSVSPESYTDSLRVMYRFWSEGYREDFADPVYRKMMVCLSLTHAAQIQFWVGPSGSGTDASILYSDPVRRYEIYKGLYDAGELVDYFADLQVPEMRMVMGSNISDDEIVWMRDQAKLRNDDWGGYTWLRYTSKVAYYSDQYYDPDTWVAYDEKYGLSDYGITNYGYGTTTSVKYPKLWTALEEGGVCWQMSNFSQNVLSSYGRPSIAAGGLGWSHSLTMVYNRTADGNGTWTIGNSSGADWNNTNYHAYEGNRGFRITRWMNDWGVGTYADENNASYIILAQAAVNDYDNFVRSEEIVMLADALSDEETKEQIYRDAQSVQEINFDAWYDLVGLYASSSDKTDEEKVALADELTDALTYFPLPMHDLLKILKASVSSSSYGGAIDVAEMQALTTASAATDADSLQPYAVKVVANWLLGKGELDIASFSFDGENAGCICLDERFENPDAWQYSIDGGESWSEEILYMSVLLTEEEIAAVNAEDDILIRFVPTASYLHTIDITKGAAPSTDSLYANDWENRLIGSVSNLECSTNGGLTWEEYTDETNFGTGDVSVLARYRAYGTRMCSDALAFSFTADTDTDTKKYVPISEISLYAYSSQNDASTRAAKNMIDGTENTFWHNTFSGETYKYYAVEFSEDKCITAMDYIPAGGNNGRLKAGEIYASEDGENFTLVTEFSGIANSAALKTIEIDHPMTARYLKIVYTESYGNSSGEANKYASGKMFNFYEDLTARPPEEEEEDEEMTQQKRQMSEEREDLLHLHNAWITEEQHAYTDASWAALTDALAQAEAVLADESASKEEILSALFALHAAIEGLEEDTMVDDPDFESEEEKRAHEKESQDTEEEAEDEEEQLQQEDVSREEEEKEQDMQTESIQKAEEQERPSGQEHQDESVVKTEESADSSSGQEEADQTYADGAAGFGSDESVQTASSAGSMKEESSDAAGSSNDHSGSGSTGAVSKGLTAEKELKEQNEIEQSTEEQTILAGAVTGTEAACPDTEGKSFSWEEEATEDGTQDIQTPTQQATSGSGLKTSTEVEIAVIVAASAALIAVGAVLSVRKRKAKLK